MARIKMQPQDTASATLSECFKDYMTKCKARNLSDKTIELYNVRFSVFSKCVDVDEFKASELTQSTIDKFILYLQSRGCNDITVQSYIPKCICFRCIKL